MDEAKSSDSAPNSQQEIESYLDLVSDAMSLARRIDLSDFESSEWLEGKPRMDDQEFIDRFLKAEWIDLWDKSYRGYQGGSFSSRQVAALIEVIEDHLINSIEGMLMDGGIDLRECAASARARVRAMGRDPLRDPARRFAVRLANEAVKMNPRISNVKLAHQVFTDMKDSSDGLAVLVRAGYKADETSLFGEAAIKEEIKKATRDGRIQGRQSSRTTEWRRRQQKNTS